MRDARKYREQEQPQPALDGEAQIGWLQRTIMKIKSWIKGSLNYKNPGFWVIVVIIVGLGVMGGFLLNNHYKPKTAPLISQVESTKDETSSKC